MSTADSSHPLEIMLLFFIFSVFFACTGKTASAKCVDLNPPTVVVEYEGSFSVNCTSLSNQTKGMGWESPIKSVSLKDGVTSLLYEVDRVTDWDFFAQCYMNYINGDPQCMETLPVIVYKTPDSVSMSNPNEGGVLEGKTYTVECNVINVAPARNLFINWHKGNKKIRSNTFNTIKKTPSNESDSLVLTPKREDHESEIWCEAVLDFTGSKGKKLYQKSMIQKLNVMYLPAFDQPINETFETGGTITLDCNSTGNPSPLYTWTGPESIQHLIKGENQNQLILSRSSQVIGIYSCVAFNSIGNNTKFFEIVSGPGNRTTFAILLGVFIPTAVLLIIGGLIFVKKNGTCSFDGGSYEAGRPAAGAV